MSELDAAAREVCKLVDEAVEDRILVYGSLPPAGTDLDLLVRPAEERAVTDALSGAALAQEGPRLVRIMVGSALEVELASADSWGLTEAQLEALYAEATPLPGLERLVEPAPHHQLLILAARTSARGEPLSERRRTRIERALARDPDAWHKAAGEVAAWGDGATLERLRRLYRGEAPAVGDRLRRRLAQARRLGHGRRGLVIALSGVDGSGKSFQADALREALRAIGQPVAVEWVPLGSNPWIDRLAAPVKAFLARFRALRSEPPEEGQQGRGLVPNPGSVLRERSGVVNYLWATLVAIANGATHAFRVARHRAAGRVVIFDRYVLDSVVRSRLLYGEERALRLPLALIRSLSPRPEVSFFLDVPAATSISRKEDRWHPEELERQVRLYRQEYERCGVTRLDGERPAEDLAREIFEASWRRLRQS